MIRNNLTDAETVPDYRRFRSTESLEYASSASVKLVG